MSGSLVADAGSDPLEVFDGAGIYSSAADVVSSARPLLTGERFSPAEFGTAELGLALDALGAMDDPVGGLVAEPLVGWLIEHVAFIREPYDELAGDPGQITRAAETWHNIAGRLTEVADDHERLLGGPIGWEGEACDGYRTAAAAQVAALRRTAAEAETLAGEVMHDAALVGTVRSLIRDLIADLVTRLLTWLGGALATATVTAGATLAGCVPIVIAEAVSTLKRIVDQVRELMDLLQAAHRRIVELAARAEGQLPAALRAAWADAGPTVRGHLKDVRGPALDVVVESGKQGTKADREQANWDASSELEGWVPLPSAGRVRRYAGFGGPHETGGD